MDMHIVYTVLSLILLGLCILFTSSMVTSQRDYNDPYFFLKKQSAWAVISLVFFAVFSLIPYKIYQKVSVIILLFSFLLLSLVFIPGVGKTVDTHYGRIFHRWIRIGSYQFQPSEFVKIVMIIYVSDILCRWKTVWNMSYRHLAPPLFAVGVCLGMIVAEPAFGTAMEILLIILVLFFVDGFPLLRIFAAILSLSPLAAILVYKVGYRKKRVDVWLDPYKYRFEEGHQLVSSFRSFLDGSWFGQPLTTGYSHRHLTYGHTDFILAPLVEDYGFVGFLCISILTFYLIFRSVILLRKMKEGFGLLLGTGITGMIALQFLLNTFVVTGIVPITGISLPFISYGGSSLLSVMIGCGILLNITRKENLSA